MSIFKVHKKRKNIHSNDKKGYKFRSRNSYVKCLFFVSENNLKNIIL